MTIETVWISLQNFRRLGQVSKECDPYSTHSLSYIILYMHYIVLTIWCSASTPYGVPFNTRSLCWVLIWAILSIMIIPLRVCRFFPIRASWTSFGFEEKNLVRSLKICLLRFSNLGFCWIVHGILVHLKMGCHFIYFFHVFLTSFFIFKIVDCGFDPGLAVVFLS